VSPPEVAYAAHVRAPGQKKQRRHMQRRWLACLRSAAASAAALAPTAARVHMPREAPVLLSLVSAMPLEALRAGRAFSLDRRRVAACLPCASRQRGKSQQPEEETAARQQYAVRPGPAARQKKGEGRCQPQNTRNVAARCAAAPPAKAVPPSARPASSACRPALLHVTNTPQRHQAFA